MVCLKVNMTLGQRHIGFDKFLHITPSNPKKLLGHDSEPFVLLQLIFAFLWVVFKKRRIDLTSNDFMAMTLSGHEASKIGPYIASKALHKLSTGVSAFLISRLPSSSNAKCCQRL